MATALQTLMASSAITNAQFVAKMGEESVLLCDPADVPDFDLSLQPHPGIMAQDSGDYFEYDAADTTSVHDGSTVLVDSTGRRYKLKTTVKPDAFVVSLGDETPPGSPSIGDRYVLGAAPTGAWASKAKQIATWTARGWIFHDPDRGEMVWVNDENAYYHFSASDAWTQGLPLGAIGAGSLTPDLFKHPLALLVVEDTRNAPPGSIPANGTAYVVGTSPTGAFASQAGKVAYVKAGAYVFIAPFEGATVYSKEIGADLCYRSGAWGRKVAVSSVRKVYRSAVSGVNLGGMTPGVREEIGNFTVQAASASSFWIIEFYLLTVTKSGTGGIPDFYTYQLYLDSNSTATETLRRNSEPVYDASNPNNASNGVPLRFIIPAPDGASHVMRINLTIEDDVNTSTFFNAGYTVVVTEIIPE